MPKNNKVYLGDGVYADFDGEFTWIYTSDGVTNSDKIALDESTLRALVRYNERMISNPLFVTPARQSHEHG